MKYLIPTSEAFIELERAAVEIQMISGYSIEQLRTLFLAGYELKPPNNIDNENQLLNKGVDEICKKKK